MRNTFKARLQARDPQFGLFVVSNALQTAEALAGSGYDYLCFDVEHSPSSTPALHAQLTALQGSGTASVVRPVSWLSPCGQALSPKRWLMIRPVVP